MPSDFQLVPTANPLEFMVALTVPDQIVNKRLSLLPQGSFLEEYTPYNKFSWGDGLPRVEEFGKYRYVYSDKPRAGSITFYFAKPRTDEEKNTPYRTFFDTHQFVWPAVLLDLYFISSTFPETTYNGTTTVTATRYFQRNRFIPSTPADSVIKIEQYLSDTPWTPNELVHPQPVTADIDGTFLGLNVNFQRCLHRKVILKELVPGAQIVFGSGMEGSDRGGTPQQQVFPATNFVDWRPFVFSDGAKLERGMYAREKVTIYPPSRTEPIQN